MSVEPPTVDIWHVALGLIAAGAAWAWKFVTGDIRRLRDTTVTKDTFEAYGESAQKQRDELRESIIKLYEGQTALTRQMNDQHVTILHAIHEVHK